MWYLPYRLRPRGDFVGVSQGRLRDLLQVLMAVTGAVRTMPGRRNDAGAAVDGQANASIKRSVVRDKVSGFMSLIRPLFFILTPVNAASAAVLAYGGFPSLSKCIAGFFSVAFASCAVNVFNDYIDRERDKTIWPDRAIPGGRVRPGEALLVAAISMVVGLSLAWLVFNPTTFLILLLAIVSGGFYSVYLRDRVGYLSLPPIVGLIYLGGWAAFYPETLFTSLIPWYLYLLGVAWQAAHIMVYYPLHMTPGKYDKSNIEVPPVLFSRPSPRTAVKTGIVFIVLTLVLALLLPLLAAPAGYLYLFLVIAAGTFALLISVRFLVDMTNRRLALGAFTALSLFRLVISAAILLSVLISW